MRKMIFQVSKNDKMIFSLAWNKYHVYWLIKGSCFDFFADGKNGLFWAKRMMEMWYLLITEKLFFRPFQRCEIQSFWSQKVDGKIFTDYWKALFLNLSVMGNIVFFEPKVDGKSIFTWSFWAIHDIPGLEQYGFCAVNIRHRSGCFIKIFELFLEISWFDIDELWNRTWSKDGQKNL